MPRWGQENLTSITQGLQAFGFDFVQSPTESIPRGVLRKPDGTQIWLLVHNGVDTHSIHFHLVNVQVVNRVDGPVSSNRRPQRAGLEGDRPDEPVGKRDCCGKAGKTYVPFKVPTCVRPLNVTMPPTVSWEVPTTKISNPNPLWNFDCSTFGIATSGP